MTQELQTQKTALRAEMKQVRDALTEQQRRDYSRAIRELLLQLPQLQAARSVFCFISHGSEVDTRPLLDQLLKDGKTVTSPRITRDQGMIAVPFRDWNDLVPGQLGILTPSTTQPYPGDIDLCITPGLAFTVSGRRLGYGRGYYDRWFAGHAVADRIAVGFECQVVDDLPADANDIPVTMLVTERRLVRIS
jgi:5-formyltetrahydrofolate cyclo-ligase